MQESVKIDRHKFLGGSDIPIILGISPFKTRWQLLREKARLEEDTFTGNAYTTYGNVMEGKIRDYINEVTHRNFVEGKHESMEENQTIGVRCHTDGEDATTILEIKTTSDIEGNLELYKAQLCFYMLNTDRVHGVLACYLRPEDMSEEFDKDRLVTYYFNIATFYEEGLVDRINEAIRLFIIDLNRLKDNPFLSEEDLIPDELLEVANQVVAFEQRLAELKEQEKQIKAEKQKLYEKMCESNVKKWETWNGYKITRVDGTPESEKEVEDFDSEKFEAEHPKLYKQYCSTKIIKVSAKSGYVRITPPKEKE